MVREQEKLRKYEYYVQIFLNFFLIISELIKKVL